MYLLDTKICIALLKENPQAVKKLIATLANIIYQQL